MSARFCIGSRVDASKGKALAELPLAAVDVLLDFISDQEEQDGKDYRTQIHPLRFAVTEGPGDPDWLEVWTEAKGWTRDDVVSALELGVFLLERHGSAWMRDPDWLPAGIGPAALKRLLQTAVEYIRDSNSSELLTWVQR